jgi:Fe/S biogenesis protein NfuA
MMLTITQTAQEKISEAIKHYTKPVDGLRVMARRVSPFHIEYGLSFVPEKGGKDTDEIKKYDGFDVYTDKETAPLLENTSLNFEDGPMGSGFKFEGDSAIPQEYKGTLAEKVLPVIENQVNPQIAGHGGFVRLMDVKGTEVFVQLGGGCQGCGMAKETLKNGIEVMIKEAIPEVTAVIDVTDHSGGSNPYYK